VKGFLMQLVERARDDVVGQLFATMAVRLLFNLLFASNLEIVACWYPSTGSQNLQRNRLLCSLSSHAQRWKLAEECDDASKMPLPDWAKSVDSLLQEPMAQLTPRLPTWRVQNPTPLWVAMVAQVTDPSFRVSPFFGYLAPSGGTTNLCNEEERYQDFCEFTVQFPETFTQSYLVIQTEEGDSWTLELGK
jgi:hypothetical protein